MQIGSSGVLTSLYRMDVLSNNLANVSTVGFKPDAAAVMQRDVVRVEDGLGSMPSNKLLEMLGGGVHPAQTRVSFTQGTVSTTGNPLDLAIRGEGFFVMQDAGGVGADRFRLSRDGRFTRDAQGRLVSATSGLPVMDVSNRPIFLATGAPVTVDSDGTVTQAGNAVAQIQLIDVPDKSRLHKVGHGLFAASAEAWGSRRGAAAVLTQGAVEESAVDPIRAIMAITDAGRAAESNMGMVSNHDRMLDRAINTLGRGSGS